MRKTIQIANSKYWIGLLFFICSLVISPAGALAQGITSVSGTVSDDFDALMGASVCEVDANGRIINATTTDLNGHFTMRIRDQRNKLRFSFVGCQTQTLSINRATYNIHMSSATVIQEVTVQSTRRVNGGGLAIPEREASMAQQRLSMSDVEGMSFTTVDEALQGRISGLDIVSNSGNLGSGSTMRLRGAASISSAVDANPLIVVNGNEWNVDMSDFDVSTANDEKFAQLLNVNPEDIEDVTVLKDAAATAIYGSRGANGVIEIKTKRGTRGAPRLSYSLRLTGTYQPEGYKMLDGDGYTMLLKESYFNPRQSDVASNIPELNYDPTFSEYQQYNNNTNWVDAVTQWGLRQNHYLVVSGGGEKATFRISGGFDNETGSVIRQRLQRMSTRVALDYFVSDRITISTNFSLTYTKNRKNYDQLLAIAYKKMPNMGIYEQDPVTGEDTDRYYEMLQSASSVFNGSGNQKSLVNPVASANLARNNEHTYDISPELILKYRLLGLDNDSWQLNWEARANMNIFNNFTNRYYPSELVTVPWSSGVNKTYTGSSKSVAFNTKQTLTLIPHFNNEDHSLMMMGRFELVSGESNSQVTEEYGLPSGGITSLGANGKPEKMSTGFSQWRSMYYTFSAHYAYKSKYMLDFSIRADGTTKFGPERRWGYFPAVSLRWNISDEPWMQWAKGGDRNILSMISLRPSWGRVGNQPSADYLYESKYSASSYQYIDMAVMYPNNIRLSGLQWETNDQFNIGTDIHFFNDRLNIALEWYSATRRNMLMPVKIPTNTGFTNLAYKNVGSMRNVGWEFNISTNRIIKSGKFSADFNATFGNNSNKILEMDATTLETMNIKFTQENRSVLQRVQLNNPFGAIYGFRFKGVYQYQYSTFASLTHDEQAQFLADGKTAPVALASDGSVIYDDHDQPLRMMYTFSVSDDLPGKNYRFKGGDAIYEDLNNDGNINELDIVYLGSSLPKLTGGFGFTLNYGKWRLNTQFNYRFGNKILNLARLDAQAMVNNNNQSQAVNYRWRMEGDVTSIPRAMYGSSSNYNTLISDRFVEDGSFLRLNYTQLSYSLPDKSVRAIGLHGLRFYLSANNLFCLTKYTGVDPEISYSSYGAALDQAQTPRAKSYTFGLTVDF
ncbi:MAG: SusC/RagA family TonB-linked outer membrane protein [Prevotella sp.]|nr:SusC/RagA family TonB-linked outer membrane protein [Prevotella sp.]